MSLNFMTETVTMHVWVIALVLLALGVNIFFDIINMIKSKRESGRKDG